MPRTTVRSRLARLSRRLLIENIEACDETCKEWRMLAAGDLDEKPICSFCSVGRAICDDCALHAFGGDGCGEPYWAWRGAVDAAHHKSRRHPLKTKAVREKAGRMLKLIERVGRALRAELKRRGRR